MHNLEEMREEFLKEFVRKGFVARGLPEIATMEIFADWWLSKFSELEREIRELPDKYSAIDGYKVVRVEDVLKLFNHEK